MKNKQPNKKPTSIGGQAVMEGVMMRGESSMATAVRDQDGVIRLETKRIIPQNSSFVNSRIVHINNHYFHVKNAWNVLQ